ncbi:MAG: hypothetical protein AAGA94_00275 [Pseudomonadota bacterium]
MPAFTFKGFTTGDPVALSVLQGAITVPASVAAWGDSVLETFEGTFEITATTAETIPAPTAVWFEASDPQGFDVAEVPGPGDPSFDGITYVWTVERAGPGADETAHGDFAGVPHLIDGWDNARIAYGKKVAFFLDEPDTTYNVRCWAIDQSGNRGIGTRASGEEGLVITTANADDLYAGSATICLDPSGAFADAPLGAQQVTGVSALQSAIWGASGPSRVLIARGQDIADFALNDTGGGNIRYVGAFGSGPRPILRSNGISTMLDFYETSAPQLTITGLDCRGAWDATTETGRPLDAIRPFRSALQSLAIWECGFDGFSMVNPTLNDTDFYVAAIGKTRITNWQDYGIYTAASPHAHYALIGCDIAQHMDAINHSQTERNGMLNQQGPVRIAGYKAMYIGASSFLSRGGWSGGNDQPCLRLNSVGLTECDTVVDRATFEAGSVVIYLTGANAGVAEQPGNHLFDKALVLAGGGKTGREMVFANFGGSTFRNVICAMLDAPSFHGIAFNNCLDFTPDQNGSANLTTPVKVYNCTSLNTRSAAHDFGDSPALAGPSDFSDYTYENNVVHAPTLDTPVPANAVTMTGASVFAPRYRGIRPNFDFEQGTLADHVGMGSSFTLPYPSGTDQAYWQAIAGLDTLHMMRMDNKVLYAAYDGSFTVAFEAGQVRITNTSRSAWAGGSAWKLRLDRKSQLPAMNTTYGNPVTLSLPVPVPGSNIASGHDGPGSGVWAYDDFLGAPRPFTRSGQPQTDHTGTLRPTAGRAQGAVQS